MAAQWLPQDDILLKTSIEDGASLESLARGAVEFSRKFTLKELHDRWHSILYDPVVSAQVCARIAKFESKSKKLDISDEFNQGKDKRKAECIRNCYYAKKRACTLPLSSGDMDMDILMDNSFMHETFLGNEFFGPSGTLEDPMYPNTAMNFLDDFWIGETSHSKVLPDLNIFDETKPVNNSKFLDCGTSYGHLKYSHSLPEMSNWQTVEHMMSEMPDNDVGEGTSYNPSFSDQKNAIDWTDDYFADDKNEDGDDTSSLDGFHDHLLNTLEYVNEEEMSSLDGIKQGPEYRDGVICCAFNTEDPDIPCNNITFPSKRPMPGNKKPQKKAKVSLPCSKDTTRTPPPEKSLNTTNMEPKVSVSAGVGKSIHTETRKEVKMNVRDMKHSAPQVVSAPAPPVINEKEVVSPEHQHDIDGDIPSASDVESMILNMDLLPADQDPHCSVEVVKYQEEDAMKDIIRLEQNADSCMQRDIATHGAFAALFGRRSKHYIKKAEVLLGRESKGVSVDIDLTREGRSNTISRRQASIKMREDGTFSLTNLGNKPIYVNSEEVLPGFCLDLHSHYLIEIRDLIFTFTVNQQRVKRYLDDLRAV